MAEYSTGIYEIRNLVNGKRYIGSAVNFGNRWRQHAQSLVRGDHHSKQLQRSWRKYGSFAFQFNKLLACRKEDLLMYEQICIDHYKPEYNSAPKAGSNLGLKMSAEARAKMSAAAKRTRNFTGRTHTAESRAKISASRKGKGGGPMSADRKAKIGVAHKGRLITAEQRAKISATLMGHKQSPQQVAKRQESMPKGHYERVAMAKAKLNDEQVQEVLSRLSRSESRGAIAKAFDVTINVISRIARGESYAWVAR